MGNGSRRIVITGLGVVSPLGCSADAVRNRLEQGLSGIGSMEMLPARHLPTKVAAEARDFRGEIADFGPLEKTLSRNIKKNLKVMCREIEMGVAAAQLALTDGGFVPEGHDPDRFGVVFGCDYLLTQPEEFLEGIRRCQDEAGKFDFGRWADQGLPKVEPLWLLKYLPNMPASHVAIFNDLRGPNNSLTLREAGSNMAIGEAVTTLQRGWADRMLAGATGTRLHLLRTLHVLLQEQVAPGDPDDPAASCRPFDRDRSGSVVGEGAGVLMLETEATALARGARIRGEIVGHASSTVVDRRGAADYRAAFRNVMRMALQSAGLGPNDIGHVNAHGLGTTRCDRDEAAAIRDVFGDRPIPVVAPKSYHGNLGAGSGIVEAIGSLLALEQGRLFRTLNYRTPDPECPIAVVSTDGVDPGDSFISLNVTPQGQAAAIIVRRYA